MEILAAMQPYLIVLPKTSLRQDNYMIPSHMTCEKPNLKYESNDSYSSKNGPFTHLTTVNSDQSPIHSGPHQGHCIHCLCLGITGPRTLWIRRQLKNSLSLSHWIDEKSSTHRHLQKHLNFIFTNDDEVWERPDSKLQQYKISSFNGRIIFQWYMVHESWDQFIFPMNWLEHGSQ